MAIYLKIYLVVHLMVSVNYQGAYATIGHKGVQSNLIFLDLGLVYQMHYILNLESSHSSYLRNIQRISCNMRPVGVWDDNFMYYMCYQVWDEKNMQYVINLDLGREKHAI